MNFKQFAGAAFIACLIVLLINGCEAWTGFKAPVKTPEQEMNDTIPVGFDTAVFQRDHSELFDSSAKGDSSFIVIWHPSVWTTHDARGLIDSFLNDTYFVAGRKIVPDTGVFIDTMKYYYDHDSLAIYRNIRVFVNRKLVVDCLFGQPDFGDHPSKYSWYDFNFYRENLPSAAH